MSAIICKVCDRGSLHSRKLYRMSPTVVGFGWLLLVPSLLVLIVAGIGLAAGIAGVAVGSGVSASEARWAGQNQVVADFDDRFKAAGIPHSYLVALAETRKLSSAQMGWLSRRQRQLLSEVQIARAEESLKRRGDDGAVRGIAGMSVMLFASLCTSSFMFGLIGWLLVMKKKVLQCSSCGAVVAAS